MFTMLGVRAQLELFNSRKEDTSLMKQDKIYRALISV